MRVLVLGGTGAMGAHLVRMLAEGGAEVAVTSRSREGGSGQIRYLRGNAHDIPFISGVLSEGWDAIVDFMVYSTESFKARAELLLGATTQYVFISTARVYADSVVPIAEDSPRLLDVCSDAEFLATDEYALTKARQEDILRDSGLGNWTVIRPYITYAEERLQLGVLEKEGWLYRAMKGRTIVFSSDIAAKLTTLTYGVDVADGIRALIGETGALGEAFNVTSGVALSWGEVLDIYLESLELHLGFRPKVKLQGLEDFSKVHQARYQIKYDRMFDRRFDNSKIDRFLRSRDFVLPETGLKKCLASFMTSPKFKALSWRGEAYKDRQTGEKASLSEIAGVRKKLEYSLFRYILH